MPDKKISLSNSAAKITSVKLESNNLITYFTEDSHNLFVGALVSISGVTGGPAGATQPNPVVSNIYRIDNPTTFTVYSTTAYTATSFPATFTSTGLVKAAQGSLSGVKLTYAQPVKAVRPAFFNYVSPTITALASGNKVLLSWDASGIANPTPIVSVGRYDSSNTFLGTVAGTSASITSITNSSGVVTYTGTNTFIPGQTVTITGASSTAYNVTLPVATATTGSFTISTTATGTTSTASATALTPTNGTLVIDPTGTDLTNGAVYNYQIIAANSASTVSASTSVTTLYANAPTSVTAISATNSASVSVSWPLPVATANITSYQIQRSVAGGAYATNYATSTTNSYVDTGVTGTQSFAYKIVALASYATAGTGTVVSGTSVASTTITPVYIVPPVPTAAATASTANSITVTWSAPSSSSSITGYSLQRSSDNGSTWSANVTLTSPTATTYIDSSAISSGGLSYIYRLSGSNSSLTSDYTSSNAASSYYLNYVSLSAANTSLSTTTVTISGSYQSNPALTGYNIQRATSVSGPFTDIVATNYSTQLPYIDTTVAQGTQYWYTVTAKNAQLTSATSASVSVTTYSLPDAPVLTTSNVNAFSNQLSWTAPSSSFAITNYTLERSPDNSTWTGIYTGTTRSFTDLGLTQTTTYYYRVRANTAAGSGANSTVSTQATRTAATRVATFNASGTWTKPNSVSTANVLVVAGGQGGGYSMTEYVSAYSGYQFTVGGGGGAGQVIYSANLSIAASSSYTITVGAGGGVGGGTYFTSDSQGTKGGNSSFGSLVTALGNSAGAGGTYYYDVQPNFSAGKTGVNGGSNGYTAGSAGGASGFGGGGGGAGGAGSSTTGGAGVAYSISGTSITYGRGGNGGSGYYNSPSSYSFVSGGSPVANTGSGGSATGFGSISAGAAGVVIVSWID